MLLYLGVGVRIAYSDKRGNARPGVWDKQMYEAHTFCIYNYLELLTALFGLDLALIWGCRRQNYYDINKLGDGQILSDRCSIFARKKQQTWKKIKCDLMRKR